MNRHFKIFSLALLSILIFSCQKEVFVPDEGRDGGGSETKRESHDNGFPANYDIVFGQDKVHKMVIEVTAENWTAMQADLRDKVKGGGGPGGTFSNENPSYFPANIYYNDLVWNNVGLRYKGNSTLRANSGKLPFRIDMDEYEDQYPETKDQRFYGFKELSLSSNYNDASLIREKAASEIFRDFGVPAVRTAFYEIYINKGSGEEYFGLYTLCEVVADNFLKDYFGSKTGNCYKPEDDGANFAKTGFTLDGFALETNEDIVDKSDITEMHTLLHADTRTTDAVLWRIELEKVFDVDGFLKYLAANNTIQNWDTYGKMPHNYFLYHDPADGLIKWIVWDNNEAFQNGKQGGAISFAMNEVNTSWPLINYIKSDPVYFATYKGYVKEFIETTFTVDKISAKYSKYQDLLAPSADAERSGFSYVNGQFNSAINTMKAHNVSRVAAAEVFVK